MKDKVLSAIKQHNMIQTGDRVIAALSGGADSVALLCVLQKLQGELGITLSACHVNHCLRGAESDGDERFCRQLCERLDIPFTAVLADVPAYCRETGASVELGARELRYKALIGLDPDARIATAHTLSDNAETVLLNLSRGTALDGLCGIPPVRGRIIRPLIGCTREEIERYLAEAGEEFVTDSSNLSDDYSRNRLRHHAVPVLKSINPAFEQTVGRMSRALCEDAALLNDIAENALADSEFEPDSRINEGFERFLGIYPDERRFDIGMLGCQPRPVRLRCIKLLLSYWSLRIDTERLLSIDDMLQKKEGSMDLGGGAVLCCKEGILSIKKSFPPFDFASQTIPIHEAALTKYDIGGGYRLGFRPIDGQEIKLFVNNRSFQFKNAIDCDKINGIVTLRKRIPGDGIRLAGHKYRKSFKNLFNEAKLPAAVRDSLAVLSDGDKVLWAEGFGADRSIIITENTRRALLPYITED